MCRSGDEPHYKFEYEVKDDHHGDYKKHRESRKGDDVEGYYSLLQPDGTIREVHYTSAKHAGFNAVVTHHGKPIEHPEEPKQHESHVPEQHHHEIEHYVPEHHHREIEHHHELKHHESLGDFGGGFGGEFASSNSPVPSKLKALKPTYSKRAHQKSPHQRRPYSVWENTQEKRRWASTMA